LVEDAGFRCTRAIFANSHGKMIGQADMAGGLVPAALSRE
jgi:hypothetical protein